MPTAQQFFELLLQGLHIPFTSTFDVPELQLTAKLEPEWPLRLIVSVTDVSEQEADKRASKFAQELKSYTSDFFCDLGITLRDQSRRAWQGKPSLQVALQAQQQL